MYLKSLLLPKQYPLFLAVTIIISGFALQASSGSLSAQSFNETTSAFTEESDTLFFLLRVDDIYFRGETYGGMDVPHNFTDFQTAVEKYGAKVTWGVIPHRLKESLNESGHMTRDLIESVERGHEVSVHGYTHICSKCGSPGHEMYCNTYEEHFTYDEQAEMIQNSLDVLADSLNVQPSSFIAPGHNLDNTTYEVMADHDLPVVSMFRSGTGGDYPKTVMHDVLDIPVHAEFTWAIGPGDYEASLDNALADIKSRGQIDGFYNLMLHDPFIRPGYHDGLVIDWTADLLDSLTTHYEDRIRFVTLSEAAEIYHAEQVSADDDETLAEMPDQIHLKQNYPNPFNPETVIKFELSSAMPIRLAVYDALGRKITVLESGRFYSGSHQTVFDASNLSGGIYVYRLQTPEQTLTRKMLLVK